MAGSASRKKLLRDALNLVRSILSPIMRRRFAAPPTAPTPLDWPTWTRGAVRPTSVPRRTFPRARHHILAEMWVFRKGRHVATIPAPSLRFMQVVTLSALCVPAVADDLHRGTRSDRAD
jgi:hypothetical protein